MNLDRIRKVADAVLYEGYMLYPYRPSSVKNRQRFNFGVLGPPAWCAHEFSAVRPASHAVWGDAGDRDFNPCSVVGRQAMAILGIVCNQHVFRDAEPAFRSKDSGNRSWGTG